MSELLDGGTGGVMDGGLVGEVKKDMGECMNGGVGGGGGEVD